MTIPLLHARLCVDLDCQTVFDAREARVCPKCAFALTAPISRWINRKPSKEAPHARALGLSDRGR